MLEQLSSIIIVIFQLKEIPEWLSGYLHEGEFYIAILLILSFIYFIMFCNFLEPL